MAVADEWHINSHGGRQNTFAKKGLVKLTDPYDGESSDDEPAYAFSWVAIGRPTMMMTCLPNQDIVRPQTIDGQ